METSVPDRTYGEVKVIFDPSLVVATTGNPVDAVITYEDATEGLTMVVTFGAKTPESSDAWTHLAQQLRIHAGAPMSPARSGAIGR